MSDIIIRHSNSSRLNKRPRSDSSSSSSLVAMPVKTYRKSANRRGLYKKKPRYYRRLSLTTQLTRAQNAVHHLVMSSTSNWGINGTTGFVGGSDFDKSLQFVFNETGVFYSLGFAAPAILGTGFANAASYAIVFDQWRLDKVVAQMVFSSNSSQVNQTTQLPVIYAVTDPNEGKDQISVIHTYKYIHTYMHTLLHTYIYSYILSEIHTYKH
jgi:hypothetical protein